MKNIKVKVVIPVLYYGIKSYKRGDIIEVPEDFALKSSSVKILGEAISSPVATMSIIELTEINPNVINLLEKFNNQKKEIQKLKLKTDKKDEAIIKEYQMKLSNEKLKNKEFDKALKNSQKEIEKLQLQLKKALNHKALAK